MAPVLLFPVAIIGVLSTIVLVKLAYIAAHDRIPLGLLLNMAFRGLPVGLLCRVKREMEEWGLKIEMREILDAYIRRLGQGGRTYAAMENELRQAIIDERKKPGLAVPTAEGSPQPLP
ncbi:MAG: hypothetical protein U0166_08670 [Acidobacteriota bacterium]